MEGMVMKDDDGVPLHCHPRHCGKSRGDIVRRPPSSRPETEPPKTHFQPLFACMHQWKCVDMHWLKVCFVRKRCASAVRLHKHCTGIRVG